MPDLKIDGALIDLLMMTLAMQTVILNRKANGWSLFQSDEDWEYRTRNDERVCPKCEEFGSQHRISGPSVDAWFPDKRRLSGQDGGLFHPDIHITYPEWKGQCRCRVEFQNISETLIKRLDWELRSVI